MSVRISRKRLEELDRQLADKDKCVLRSLQMGRYMVTSQLKRLHYTDHASDLAALRATNRGLLKLQDYGLIASLERRIGGVRAGSGAYVWLLTEAGDRLLHMSGNNNKPRKRFFEPSPAFLEHTLAVSESYVQIIEACRKHDMELDKAELEPNCWRTYTDEYGRTAYLKPDLFSVILDGEYEDRFFIEIDLDTEAPSVVMEKCKRYAHYYKTGVEQKQYDVFPLVVWIVPRQSRLESLRRYIADSRDLTPQEKSIFVVITAAEFETLLCGGVDALRKDEAAND